MPRSPLIGVSACSRKLEDHDFHIAGDKYLRAAALAGLPLVIPALESLKLEDLLENVDGLLFTGSPSNVEPHRYSGPGSAPGTLHDPARDDLTLPLIRAAVDAGIPVFGICRGFQEMNVAFGGSLHQKVHELPGYLDHREDPEAPLPVQYGFSHDLLPEPGGLLQRLGLVQRCQVNSLHSQGIDRLGDGLRVEARAPDGLIEAISVEGARSFALGVQWHPEWDVQAVPHYLALFRGFADACRAHAEQR
ncbi:gamma-glutamyl-gamma-aminobutyrate hydrolase family protein [Stutzerimonas kirkiae]|uniref:gamma-glutamyl-gamma-aminobutyrate hydrolase n=1 Tax=Stutzerimonas kirkiae TaxID=2211392 RepID=A0A4V2KDF4_9GAMM|nr:gamma-glutamyl-gamma-aminobutyrate hydrolase family protein [Stutzerimonas kirkiae]TBU99167.1 gamma-glutamyl-gamma-aminobutyrate hydrolase [Stutzerimonas kirkiae]TBV06373.1 gamma-glutamyl-gamma-aminobutyrate hydrolase [Stutzerimonas kirkiae]TBV07495.1 gamma-glutamyl-gamma-aminobutyrate hydrolase [Stutzerimonas kirkiae]TBV15736.1 gamma-glutamyl-gamma-aminobutyrate hydrolase [Stutzerimonas kirkiae]